MSSFSRQPAHVPASAAGLTVGFADGGYIWTSQSSLVRHKFDHHSSSANAYYVDDGDSGDLITENLAHVMRGSPWVVEPTIRLAATSLSNAPREWWPSTRAEWPGIAGLTIGEFPWVARGVQPLPTDRLQGFYIADEDRIWIAADARIGSETLLVSSPAVPHPPGGALRLGPLAPSQSLQSRRIASGSVSHG